MTSGSRANESPRLREERSLFARRAALPAPAPPPFSAVMGRVHEAAHPKKPRRIGLISFLAAAAAFALGIVVVNQPPDAPKSDEVIAIVAEPAASAETCRDPRSIATGAATREERAYGACLVGTPNCVATEEEKIEAFDAANRGQNDGETNCSVTCDSGEPHPGEVLDARSQGDCGP